MGGLVTNIYRTLAIAPSVRNGAGRGGAKILRPARLFSGAPLVINRLSEALPVIHQGQVFPPKKREKRRCTEWGPVKIRAPERGIHGGRGKGPTRPLGRPGANANNTEDRDLARSICVCDSSRKTYGEWLLRGRVLAQRPIPNYL